MSTDNNNQNPIIDESKKDSSTKKQSKSFKSRSKGQKNMQVKTKEDQERKLNPKLKDDSFYFSPILLLGLFITAIGVGYLIPGSGGLDSPAYQTWSIIIAGVAICVPGLYQQIKHHYDAKNQAQNKSKKSNQ